MKFFMMKKNQKLIFSTILFLSSIIHGASTDDCIFNQPHITFGDHFKNKSSDHIFTIGVVSRGENCTKDPQLSITGSNPQNPDYKNPYTKKYQDPEVEYTRIAYFWYIKKDQLESSNNKKWKIIIDSESSKSEANLGFFEFPHRYADLDEPLRIGIVADMDITERAMPTLNELFSFDQNRLDFLVHDGDMAYDIHDDKGMLGDYFFNNMSKITTKIPYSPLAGNHEFMDFGAFMNYRFRLPGFKEGDKTSVKYFSFDLKHTHFIFVDFDYFYAYYTSKQNELFDWLYKDLKNVEENPDIKWKVFFTHRPFYCSDIKFTKDCKTNFITFRKIEILLEKFKVDLVMTAHLHGYMRNKMMKDWEIFEYPESNKPKFPIHVTSGHSGTKHFFNTPADDKRFYSVPITEKAENQYASWVELEISKEKLHFRLRNSGKGTIADEFVIDKRKSSNLRAVILIFVLLTLSLLMVWVLIKILNRVRDGEKREDEAVLKGDEYLSVEDKKHHIVDEEKENIVELN